MLNSEKLEKQFKDYLVKNKYHYYKAQACNREFIVFIEKNEIKKIEDANNLKNSILNQIDHSFREQNMEMCYLDELSFKKSMIKHYNPFLKQEMEDLVIFKGLKPIFKDFFKEKFLEINRYIDSQNKKTSLKELIDEVDNMCREKMFRNTSYSVMDVFDFVFSLKLNDTQKVEILNLIPVKTYTHTNNTGGLDVEKIFKTFLGAWDGKKKLKDFILKKSSVFKDLGIQFENELFKIFTTELEQKEFSKISENIKQRFYGEEDHQLFFDPKKEFSYTANLDMSNVIKKLLNLPSLMADGNRSAFVNDAFEILNEKHNKQGTTKVSFNGTGKTKYIIETRSPVEVNFKEMLEDFKKILLNFNTNSIDINLDNKEKIKKVVFNQTLEEKLDSKIKIKKGKI